jgi:hypothetical protein
MWAVIFEAADDLGAGLRDIAGRPLLIRQLQWLRDNHVAPVVVEVSDGPHAARLAALLLGGGEPLLEGCIVLPSAAPLGLAGAAARAGAPRGEPLLGLASDLLVSGALPAPCREGRYRVDAPPGFAGARCEFSVTSGRAAPASARQHAGWGLRIESHATAHALSCAVLDGRAPDVLVHAAQVRPGVWLSRGARAAAAAQLRAPVLIGPGARVLAGATVGPQTILGGRALVERGARVARASVAEDTWVGEGANLYEVRVEGARVESLADGEQRLEADPLLLRARRTAGTAPGARVLALLLVCLLALPWSLSALLQRARGRPVATRRRLQGQLLWFGALGSRLDCVPALLDVARGRRDLLGPTDPGLLDELAGLAELRLAAFDLTPALARSPNPDTRRRMWCWYALHRSPGLALRLAWRGLLGRLGG